MGRRRNVMRCSTRIPASLSPLLYLETVPVLALFVSIFWFLGRYCIFTSILSHDTYFAHECSSLSLLLPMFASERSDGVVLWEELKKRQKLKSGFGRRRRTRRVQYSGPQCVDVLVFVAVSGIRDPQFQLALYSDVGHLVPLLLVHLELRIATSTHTHTFPSILYSLGTNVDSTTFFRQAVRNP